MIGDAADHRFAIPHFIQRDPPGAVGEVLAAALGQLQREARLAHAAETDDGQQARVALVQHFAQLRQFAVAAHEAGGVDGQVRAQRVGSAQGRVAARLAGFAVK